MCQLLVYNLSIFYYIYSLTCLQLAEWDVKDCKMSSFRLVLVVYVVYQNRFDKLSGDIGCHWGAIWDREHTVRNFIICGNWHWYCRWDSRCCHPFYAYCEKSRCSIACLREWWAVRGAAWPPQSPDLAALDFFSEVTAEVLLWDPCGRKRKSVARIVAACETIQNTPGTFDGVPEHAASQQYMLWSQDQVKQLLWISWK
jgi:hypothetical protein